MINYQKLEKKYLQQSLNLIENMGKYDKHYTWIEPHKCFVKDSLRSDILKTIIAIDPADNIVGLATGYEHIVYSHLWFIVVDKKCRNHGISRDLVDYWVKHSNSNVLTAETWTNGNNRLLNHWLKCGFEVTGFVKNEFGDGDDFAHLLFTR